MPEHLTKVAPNIYRRKRGRWKVVIRHEGRLITKTFPPTTPQEEVERYVLQVKGGRGWQVLAELQRELSETLRRVNEHLDRMPMRDGARRPGRRLSSTARTDATAVTRATAAAPREPDVPSSTPTLVRRAATHWQTARPTAETVGGRIEHYRLACGWTYAQLATEADATVTSVHAHINGHAQPRALTLAKYAKAFSRTLGIPITTDELLGTIRPRRTARG